MRQHNQAAVTIQSAWRMYRAKVELYMRRLRRAMQNEAAHSAPTKSSREVQYSDNIRKVASISLS